MISENQILSLLEALVPRTRSGSIPWIRDSRTWPERHYEAQLSSGRVYFKFFSPEMERDHIKVEIVNPSSYFVANMTIWDNDPGWAMAKSLLEAIENHLGRPQETLDAMLQEVRGLAAKAS